MENQNISERKSNSFKQQIIEEITSSLLKIATSRSVEELEPYINALVDRLDREQSYSDLASASEISTHEEWSAKFHHWVNSHKHRDLPVLNDEAISRESMYPDRW